MVHQGRIMVRKAHLLQNELSIHGAHCKVLWHRIAVLVPFAVNVIYSVVIAHRWSHNVPETAVLHCTVPDHLIMY